MTDTSISATVFPQDPGTGVPAANADIASAGYFGVLSRYVGGTYVENGFEFQNVDTGANQVDITAGHAFIEDTVSDSSQSRTTYPAVQTGSTTYDTTLPANAKPCYVVILENDLVDLTLAEGENDLFLFVDPTTADSASIRHGTNVTNPQLDANPKPALYLGTVDTGPSGTTVRKSDGAVIRASQLDGILTGGATVTDLIGTNLRVINGDLVATTETTNNQFTVTDNITIQNETAANGWVTRPYGDNGNGNNNNIYVDPGGNDGAAGTQGNPVATIQEAFSRLTYLYNEEGTGIHVNAGNYTNEPADVYTPYIRHHTSVGRTYIGQPNDHTDAGPPPGATANFHIQSHVHLIGMGKNDHVGIKGIEVDGVDFVGWSRSLNCNFNPAAGHDYAVYASGGYVYLKACNIGTGPTDDYGVIAEDGAHVILENCSVSGNTDAIKIGNGAVVSATGNCTINGNNLNGLNQAGINNHVDIAEGGVFVPDNRYVAGGTVY